MGGRRGGGMVRWCALAATLLIAGACTATARAVPGDQAVAYQVDHGHSGAIADAGIAAPLAQAWSVTLPGAASYPLIVNGRVYVTTTERQLYALNQATGATIWSRGIGGGTYGWSGLAYDRGRIFTVNTDGLLTAVDAASGDTLWSKQMPGQYSFSSEPTAADGMVYVGGSGSGGTLYAVRASDGRVLWTRAVANGDHSSPALDADRVFVTYPCQDYAFSRISGDQLWHNSTGCSGGGGRTPVRAGDVLIVRDGSGGARVLSAATGAVLGPLNSGPAPAVAGGVAYALSASSLKAVAQSGTGVNLWTFAGDGGLVSAPLVAGDHVFAGSSTGMLYALDPAAGTVDWSANVGAAMTFPDEHNVIGPVTGMGAANGTIVVPAGAKLVAYRTAGLITLAPANTAPPTIDGAPQAGGRLAADVGIWSGLPNAYTYAWQRCNGAGADCSDIAGATSATYTPAEADVGATLRVRVVATNANGTSAPATSGASAVVTIAAPVSQAPPAISGTPQAGQTLTATTGSWSGSPVSYGYQWRRCTTPPFPFCDDIAGATSSSYLATAGDVGHQLVVRVTATNAAGPSDPSDSAPSAAITASPPPPPPPPPPPGPTVPVNTVPPAFSGFPQVGQTLTAANGSWSGNPTSYRYQWFSCDAAVTSCPDISGATKQSYVVAASDLGRYVGVEIVATNAAGDSEPAYSDAYGPVSFPYPVSTAPPTIHGAAQIGQTLVADAGAWTNNPYAFGFQWYRCNAAVTSCGPIAGATASTYAVSAADTGGRLGVGVVATNAGGHSGEALSALTATVLGAIGPPVVTPPTADSSFTVLGVQVRTAGRIRVRALVQNAGKLTAGATASAAALAKGCRTCRRTGRATYGNATAAAGGAGTATVTIMPTARARVALRRSRSIRVRVKLTFSSALGGTPTSQTRHITVGRVPAQRRSALRLRPVR